MKYLKYEYKKINDVDFIDFPELEKFGIKILCSTSKDIKFDDSLDKKKCYVDKICSIFFDEEINTIACHQIHSCDIVTNITEKELTNSTIFNKEYDNSDGIITNKKTDVLITKFADCTPIVLFDKKNKVLANIHSGWKGTHQKIAQNAIDKMIEENNSKACDIIVFIGPCICKNCFEVKQDLIEIFKKSHKIENYIFEKDNKIFFDMQSLLIDDLRDKNISDQNIFVSNLCTFENNFLHSYRRDKEKSGRFFVFSKILN